MRSGVVLHAVQVAVSAYGVPLVGTRAAAAGGRNEPPGRERARWGRTLAASFAVVCVLARAGVEEAVRGWPAPASVRLLGLASWRGRGGRRAVLLSAWTPFYDPRWSLGNEWLPSVDHYR